MAARKPVGLYAPRIEIAEPAEVIIHLSAKPLLNSDTEAVLLSLLEILEREARRGHIPVRRVDVTGFIDPEEDEKQVVVTQRVIAPAQLALDYWDTLDLPLEEWTASLPENLQSVATEQFAIVVEWDDNDQAS
jgi:hypothetical protein